MQKSKFFSDEEILFLLTCNDRAKIDNLHKLARKITKNVYKNKIYIRGLIEFSNYCSQACYYCGINAGNRDLKRFRLSKDEILKSAEFGYENGFRTFVLQGGEDLGFSDEDFVDIIKSIKKVYKDCAITLSIGVKSKDSYKKMKQAGADRFLLRFETADQDGFKKLHPKNQSLETRVQALRNLKELGYTIGTGFLIGPPYKKNEDYLKDIKLIRELRPEMIGIGPFIAQNDTIFSNYENGSVEMTLRLISILRIENPHALIPATTALNTLDKDGRIKGILAGANVLMPNISPEIAKENYILYDNKSKGGLESGQCLNQLEKLLNEYGYEIEIGRGDYINE